MQGASDAGLIPMFYPLIMFVSQMRISGQNMRRCGRLSWIPERGLTVVEIVDAAHERSIKGIYVMGENPIMSDPDQAHARDAFARLDHLVVQDIFMTETAAYADVVLPASAFPENRHRDQYRQTGSTGWIMVPMPGDARQDWWIIAESFAGWARTGSINTRVIYLPKCGW